MNRANVSSPLRAHDAPAVPDDDVQDALLLAELLAGEGARSPPQTMTGLFEAITESWAGRHGSLRGGVAAMLATSCFLVPRCGDRVLVWGSAGASCVTVLIVLERAEPGLAADVRVEPHVAIDAHRVSMRADTVALSARELLTHAEAHHVVEGTHSESVGLRVCEVGHDVRRAQTATDEVVGTLLQRTGAWFHHVVREARIHARATLFD